MNKKILIGLAAVLVAAVGAFWFVEGRSTSSDSTLKFLFVQQAMSGGFEPVDADGTYLLTLTNVSPHTIYFSDRPDREAGKETTAEFVASDNVFSLTNPPNAAIEVTSPRGEASVIVKILDRSYDAEAATLTYTVSVLDATEVSDGLQRWTDRDIDIPPAFFESAHLFIDSGPIGGLIDGDGGGGPFVGQVTLHLQDEEGESVPGATVRIGSDIEHTDSNGNYVLKFFGNAGCITFYTSKLNEYYAPGHQWCSPNTDTSTDPFYETFTITMLDATVIDVTALDSKYQPISDATVTIGCDKCTSYAYHTDANGKAVIDVSIEAYVMGNMSPHDYTITVAKDGYRTYVMTWGVTQEQYFRDTPVLQDE